MKCTDCEERLSDYIEGTLGTADQEAMGLHLRSCSSCVDLLAGMKDVLQWGATFPAHSAPDWLAGRIAASTPHILRESWRDTLAGAWRWIAEPHMAMMVFAGVLALGWVANLAGIPTSVPGIIRNPAAVYYGAESLVNRAYDEAVRSYYRSRIVSEVYCRIEQLREIAS